MPQTKPNAAAVEATLANRRSLNANQRKKPAPTASPRGVAGEARDMKKPNPAAAMPNGVPPRLQTLAAQNPAGAQARYAQFRAGQLPGQAPPAAPPAPTSMTKPMPVPGATDIAAVRELPAELPPLDGGGTGMGAGASPEILQAISQARQAAPMNPQFSASLPPEIMQRLLALRGGMGGPGAAPPGASGATMAPGLAGAVIGAAGVPGQPGMAKPGMGMPPGGAPPFNFADYWSQGGGQAPFYGGGGGGPRGGMGALASYAR